MVWLPLLTGGVAAPRQRVARRAMHCIFDVAVTLDSEFEKMMAEYLQAAHVQEVVDILLELDNTSSRHYSIAIRRALSPPRCARPTPPPQRSPLSEPHRILPTHSRLANVSLSRQTRAFF